MNSKPQWFRVSRTLKEVTPDSIRKSGQTIASALADTIVLLVRQGDEPVREYVYGKEERLRTAGTTAGFDIKPTDDDHVQLPETATSQAHPLIPWRAKYNNISNIERLRQDETETRKNIESMMGPDTYVSIHIRKLGMFEAQHVRNWVSSEHNTSEDADPLVRGGMAARVSVGAPDRNQAKELAIGVGQVLSPMMSDISHHISRPRFGMLATTGAATITEAALAFLQWWDSGLPVGTLALPVGGTVAGLVTAGIIWMASNASVFPQVMAVGAAVTLLVAMNLIPDSGLWLLLLFALTIAASAVRWLGRSAWDDIFTRPRRYWWMQRDLKAERSDNETLSGLQEHQTVVVGYPLQRSNLLIDPVTIANTWTPNLSSAGAVMQDIHLVPETLSHGGVYLGEDQNGRSCYVDPTQLHGGVSIVGEQGSGKSVLTYGFIQWADLNRATTERKVWGWDSRVISFEMKDDKGVKAAQRFDERHQLQKQWAEHYNPNMRLRRVSYLADPESPCVDMLGIYEGRNAKATAESIAATMQYSFDKGDIMNDSLDFITGAFTIAVAVTRYELALDKAAKSRHVDEGERVYMKMRQMEQQFPGAGQTQQQRSAIGWAVVALCASDGQTGSARALGQVCRTLAQTTHGEDMQYAAKAAEQLYGRVETNGKGLRFTVSDRDLLSRVRSSSNKVKQFLGCEHLFTAKRTKYTWEMVLRTPGDYHFVFAPVITKDGRKCQLPERMDRILGAWTMYRLWNTMSATCQQWGEEEGKHTMIVCDELSMLANADSRILATLHEQGRSYGLIPVFATQYPDQLPDNLLTSFMGYSTFISYNTSNNQVAEQVAARLTDSDGEDGWRAGAVVNLQKYCAAVRTRTPVQIQPAFLCHIHDFSSNPL